MSALDDALQAAFKMGFAVGALNTDYKVDDATYDPVGEKKLVTDKLHGLIEQSKDRLLPLAWLTKQVGEL